MTSIMLERERIIDDVNVVDQPSEVVQSEINYEQLAAELHLTRGRRRLGNKPPLSYANTPHGRRKVTVAEAHFTPDAKTISYRVRAVKGFVSLTIPNKYLKDYPVNLPSSCHGEEDSLFGR